MRRNTYTYYAPQIESPFIIFTKSLFLVLLFLFTATLGYDVFINDCNWTIDIFMWISDRTM